MRFGFWNSFSEVHVTERGKPFCFFGFFGPKTFDVYLIQIGHVRGIL